jgi:malate dehydrogenase
MADAILKDTKQIHSCAVMMEGEYGYSGVVSGVPVMIGNNGAEKIIEMSLKPLQKERFKNSVASVQDMIDVLNELKFFDDLN